MAKNIDELFKKIEGLWWEVDKEGENEYRLSKYSPYGQDFSIVIEGDSVDSLIESVHGAWNEFDVSEEAYLWLDHTGHGKNGAPHDMKDVYEDMENCRGMISELHDFLTEGEQ